VLSVFGKILARMHRLSLPSSILSLFMGNTISTCLASLPQHACSVTRYSGGLANLQKCFPAERVWPQKCDRCRAHKPQELPCSPPELNTRKRGPNLKDKTREKEKERSKDKSPNPPKRTPTASTSEPRSRDSTDDEDGGASTEDTAIYERPQETDVIVLKGVKREHPGDLVIETPKPKINDEDWRPAACYQPLAKGEFRILKLTPGKKDDKIISCSFDTVSVDGHTKYEAISYVWGSAGQKSMEIHLIDPQGRQHPIYIRSNLYEALKFLRHPTKVRSFWVHALCINHGDPNKEERNEQTPMKRYIFRNAENLCFWLGEDDNSKTLQTALKFIPQILDLGGIDKLVSDESAIDNWVAFVTLLKNASFGRLWLVQEVAVAPNVTVHSGPASIHYQDLVVAVAIFKKFRKEIGVLFRNTGKTCKDLTDRKIRIAERFIEVSTNALRISTTQETDAQGKQHEVQETQRLLSFEELVSYLSELESTHPLDRIYSVFAIAKDGLKLNRKTLMPDPEQDDDAMRIDYEAKVEDVYQDFVLRAIKNSHSLDIICRYWAGKTVKEDLPTWVRPKQLAQSSFDSNVSERTEADSLVGLPDHNNYHASRGTAADLGLLASAAVSRTLKVRGFRLDMISRLAPRAPEGIILSEWITLGGCVKQETKQGIRHTVPESFWRTLVADRGPKGTMTPPWYARTFRYCMLHLTPTGDINTNRLIHECEGDEGSSLLVDFLQRVQSVIWNRKFLVTKVKKWIGLAPTAAEEKDMLVILHGCNVPVVLRPFKENGKFVAWNLVGECYVHGMMDGEAMELDAAKVGPLEEFEIR
jgi:Heterokaryon incompatibility protein (HET)